MVPIFSRSFSSSNRVKQGLDRLLIDPNDFGYARGGSGDLDGFESAGNGRRDDPRMAPGNQRRDSDDRTYSTQQYTTDTKAMQQVTSSSLPTSGPTAKRGSKACVACRKGKNRCEGDPSGQNLSCRRCMANNIPCIFEKPAERTTRARNGSFGGSELWAGDAEGRVSTLERSVQDLAQGQNQIQQALGQILAMMPASGQSLGGAAAVPSYFVTGDGAGSVPTANIFQSSASPPSIFSSHSMHRDPLAPGFQMSPKNTASGRLNRSSERDSSSNTFPKLPGFAPPNHRFGTYGIIPLSSAPPSPRRSRHSSRSSSSHSVASSSALPQDSMVAPIQALQTLANAADHAAAIASGEGRDHLGDQNKLAGHAASPYDDDHRGEDEDRGRSRKRKKVNFDARDIQLRVRKKTKPDPIPRNPFPDVVTKGLVSELEARELWDIFFAGCHYFVPLWDKRYDSYETFVERTPFSTNGLLAVAAKIRAGNGPLGQTFHRCLEEAQGIARSTLFGPIVRKEAVMAMLILSVWSQNGWLPCGHALRMGLDMNLHRALDKLADATGHRSDAEERDLVVSARIWLNCYLHDHLWVHSFNTSDLLRVSLGTGKPLLLRDDSSVKTARTLLSHPMASETDMRLIAGVELVNLRIRVLERLSPLHGKVDAETIAFVQRTFTDLQDWHQGWLLIHRQRYDDESVLVKLLEVDLLYAQLWTVCVALRGSQWNRLPPDQRALALQAKDAASRSLEIFLKSANFRSHLKYATHDQLVSAAFAAVFLLKMALLYPGTLSLPNLIAQVNELAHVLSAECFAERYALTLRLMLSNFRRKTGALSTIPGTPRLPFDQAGDVLPTLGPSIDNSVVRDLDGGLASLLNLPQMGEGFETTGIDVWNLPPETEGFAWPTEFSPSNLPVWLQDGNLGDLGLPADGSDSLFLPLELANMFLPSGTASSADYQFTLPDVGGSGGEAW